MSSRPSARLAGFFSHTPVDGHSAGARPAIQRPATRAVAAVLMASALTFGPLAAASASDAPGSAPAPSVAAEQAVSANDNASTSDDDNDYGIWKALGLTALAVGYVYGNVHAARAIGRAMERRNERRARDQDDAESPHSKGDDKSPPSPQP